MPHYHVRSKANEGFCLRLSNCTPDHAESVKVALRETSTAPDDPYLVEVPSPYDDPPRRGRRFWRR